MALTYLPDSSMHCSIFRLYRTFIALIAFAICSAALCAQSSGGIRVISESAIPYAGFLSKANFDQRFPGEMKPGPGDLDTGWYVIYEHESLSYYFGPILLESTGEDYLAQLTRTVESAVQQRPTITDYRLELSYEPSESSSRESSRGSEANESSQSGSSSPPPTQTPSLDIWSLVRGIFGF